MTPYGQHTPPTVYFVNGNTNGVAVSTDGNSLYMANTGASQTRPSRRFEQGPRDLWAFRSTKNQLGSFRDAARGLMNLEGQDLKLL